MLLGKEIEEAIPYNDYFEYYAPDFKLHLTPVRDLLYVTFIKIENSVLIPYKPCVSPCARDGL